MAMAASAPNRTDHPNAGIGSDAPAVSISGTGTMRPTMGGSSGSGVASSEAAWRRGCRRSAMARWNSHASSSSDGPSSAASRAPYTW